MNTQVWRRGTSQSAVLFHSSPDEGTNYHGGDLTVNKRMSNRWSMMGGASWGNVTAKTRGGVRSNPHIINYFDLWASGSSEHRPRACGVPCWSRCGQRSR